MADELFAITTPDQLPSGAVIMFGGSAIPPGWLRCDGTSYTTASQPGLFAAIGYAYGGSGANFNVPNYQSVFPMGPTGGVLGATGGSANALVTHSHTDSGHTHSHSHPPPSGGQYLASGTPSASVTATATNYRLVTMPADATVGNAQIQNNGTGTDSRPPFQTIWFLIKI